MKSQRGISLIELLLVIAIAAVITSGAIYYYLQTLLYTKTAQAVTMIEQINKAGYEWLQIPDGSGSNRADFSGLTLEQLVTSGLLSCANQSCSTNPWGGSVMVNANGSSLKLMEIVLTSLSGQGCKRLKEQMKNIAPQNKQLAQQNFCDSISSSAMYSYHVSL